MTVNCYNFIEMELPKYIHSLDSTLPLPNTLASRVSFIRNARGIHILELAREAMVSADLIEEVESGIETWLPVTVRQRIARVLKVDPIILEEVEIKTESEDFHKKPPLEILERVQDEIIRGVKNIICPVCGNPLKSWIQEGFGLDGESIKSPKAHCTVCVFQLRF